MVHMNKNDLVHMQIKRIEKEIRDTPYHKGTEHHIGRLRARLARLKETLEFKSQKGGGGEGYAVKKQGDATIVLVGPPSAGKSTLINKLTNAQSKVAPYAFTTVSVIPGMMEYRNTYFQILDVPGLIEGAEAGKGRGREVLSVVRGADLLVLISDTDRPQALKRISDTLEEHGIRINKNKPAVRVEKKLSGGLVVKTNITQPVSRETIKEIAREMGVKNAEISITERLTLDRIVDAFSKNRVYIPAIFVLNKADINNFQYANNNFQTNKKPILISAETGQGINKLKKSFWDELNFIRIYLVRKDEEPGFNNPMTVRKETKLKDVANMIGTEFAENKKKARIWGNGAKFPAQEVSLSIKAQDGMQIRFI